MPIAPQFLRASVVGRPVGVDREAKVLRGYVVAQEGPFKSDGRGEFNEKALREIVKLGNASNGGLKSRFTHPDMSSDGLGKFLGRSNNFSLGTAMDARTGKTVKAVRGDLRFDPSAHDTPHGDLAGYVMKLAESDPEALSSSLVLKVDEEYRLNKDGTRVKDADGNELPPLWFPTMLHASDIVDTGDAVDGLLSAPQLAHALGGGEIPASLLRFDNVVRVHSQLLDGLFGDQPREVIEARCNEYLERYLSRRFGPPEPAKPTPRLDAMMKKLGKMKLTTGAKAE
jgi:hypothetical protein